MYLDTVIIFLVDVIGILLNHWVGVTLGLVIWFIAAVLLSILMGKAIFIRDHSDT